MFENIKSLGIDDPQQIDRYSLRQEAEADILKIYLKKQKGDFFAKSLKLKFPRHLKTVRDSNNPKRYKDLSEIDPNLNFLIEELDKLVTREHLEHNSKQKILEEIKHLEKVMVNKLRQLETDIERNM